MGSVQLLINISLPLLLERLDVPHVLQYQLPYGLLGGLGIAVWAGMCAYINCTRRPEAPPNCTSKGAALCSSALLPAVSSIACHQTTEDDPLLLKVN
jgi:hypothetical protein